MGLGKFLILTLLASSHFYSANAMEGDEFLNNIRAIKVQDSPNITYDGEIDDSKLYSTDICAIEFTPVFGTATDYIVTFKDDDDMTTIDEPLYKLWFVRWQLKEQKIGYDKDVIKFFNIWSKYRNEDGEEEWGHVPHNLREILSYTKSLESLVTHLEKDHFLFASYLLFGNKPSEFLVGKIKELGIDWYVHKGKARYYSTPLGINHDIKDNVTNPLDLLK